MQNTSLFDKKKPGISRKEMMKMYLATGAPAPKSGELPQEMRVFTPGGVYIVNETGARFAKDV